MAWKIDAETFYSLKEVEAGLGILKIFTLREWIKKDKLRASKMGRGYLVRGADLLEAIRDHQTTGPNSQH